MINDLIKYFTDKKILILGFGREGQSTYKLIRKYLKNQKLYIADRKDKFEERQYNIGDNQGKPGECLWQILFPYLNTQTINQALVDRGRPQGVRGLLNDAIQQNHRNRWVHIDELQGIINYINQELGAAGIERQIDYGAVEIIYNHIFRTPFRL